MRKQQVRIDFTSISQDKLVPFSKKIVQDMTTNVAIFASPTVALTTVTTQITAYADVLNKPTYPGKTGDLENARKTLETSLKKNGTYVNSIANGDLSVLEKSGYEISKPAEPVGDLLPPGFVTVKNGLAAGTFDVDVDLVEHARGYLIAAAPVSNAETNPAKWHIAWSSKHKKTIADFASGTQYKFAACAVGTTDNLFWTASGNVLFAQ